MVFNQKSSAFKHSKSSIYNSWRKTLKENQGRIESLNEKSKAPHHLRESKIDQRIKDFIRHYRKEHPRTGQDKIKPELDLFCQKMGIKSISKPTIARVIKELMSSKTATDFFEKLQKDAPFEIKRIQTDNGAEFQKRFRDALERKGIIQYFNYPRRPQINAQIERFNRTIQEDFIDWNLDLLSKNIDAFNQKLVDWLLWYNTQRTHSSLKGQSPLQYLISNLGFSKMLVYYADY